MKKSIIIAIVFVAAFAATSFAQTGERVETKVIQHDEVPAAVLQSFQNDFGTWTEKGYWKAEFIEKQERQKVTFTPEHYMFISKKNGQKVKVTYTPDGKLEDSKGISKETAGTK